MINVDHQIQVHVDVKTQGVLRGRSIADGGITKFRTKFGEGGINHIVFVVLGGSRLENKQLV